MLDESIVLVEYYSVEEGSRASTKGEVDRDLEDDMGLVGLSFFQLAR